MSAPFLDVGIKNMIDPMTYRWGDLVAIGRYTVLNEDVQKGRGAFLNESEVYWE